MSTAPATLTDWYNGQAANANNGILATGGNAANPTAAVPNSGTSNPVSNNAPSTYSGLNTANTQLGNPAQWTVTPNQTVQGNLTGILSSGSPLMQQANNEGLQTANSRGLLNSSIAAGTAENSLISAATPIATTDAQTNASAASANQNAANAFATTNASNAFNAQQNIYNQNVATANQASSQTAASNQNMQSQIGSITSQFNNDVATIQTSQTMTQQAKDYSIQQLESAYKAQLSLLSAVGTVPDVSTLLTTSIPGTSSVTSPSPGYVAAPQSTTTSQPASSSGGTVICTYYHDIGWMDKHIFKADQEYGQWLKDNNPEFMAWYWSWGYAAVDLLGESQLLTWATWPLVNCWSKEMAFRIGVIKKGNLVGKSLMFIGNI